MEHFPIPIPDNQSFLRQWYQWTQSVVSERFRRNHDRIPDVAQEVRLRLIAKDFIGRWFFKHLTDELVDKSQAERILGGAAITYIGALSPVQGRRSSPDSLWRVKDLLDFAKFDHRRYYYSIQNHTIDTETVLSLIGYPEGNYTILQSLYRQGRLRPAELTEHECKRLGVTGAPPEACPACLHGTALLKSRGLSLAHDWMDPSVRQAVSRLRWNDSQLRPFLRGWRKMNFVKASPSYVMRPDRRSSVDAGLLKYAKILITNTVNNCFKQMQRGEDITVSVLNKGMSPELSNDDNVGWEPDESSETGLCRTIKDTQAPSRAAELDVRRDLFALIARAGLTADERAVITGVDLEDVTSQIFAKSSGMTVAKVQRLRSSALQKLRVAQTGNAPSDQTTSVEVHVADVCDRYGCSRSDLLGNFLFGPPVLARTELFSALLDSGMSVQSMSSYFSYPEDRITAAINRRVLRDMRAT